MSGSKPSVPSGAAALNGTAAGAAAISLARGTATPEELAALVAVLTAAAGGAGDAPPARRSEWASRGRAVRRPLTPGPGAWRASAWRP